MKPVIVSIKHSHEVNDCVSVKDMKLVIMFLLKTE